MVEHHVCRSDLHGGERDLCGKGEGEEEEEERFHGSKTNYLKHCKLYQATPSCD